ncbi:MAG TPA: hypothetical protein VFP12_01410 [Allosphingosinicella sp.]|nr:hypothetical protein [Allosphingosinicella sp.]
MSRKLMLGKLRTLAASLVLAGAAISGTTASAQSGPGPNCHYDIISECATKWQAWGYHNYDDCARVEPCMYCLNGYLCGWIDYWAPGKHGEG